MGRLIHLYISIYMESFGNRSCGKPANNPVPSQGSNKNIE
jgi:hypothetical protein